MVHKNRMEWSRSNVPSKKDLDDNTKKFYDSMVNYLLQTKNARDAAVKLISWLLDKILRTKNGKRKLDTFRVNYKPIVETKQQCCAHLSPEPNFTVDGLSFKVSQIWIVLNHIFVHYQRREDNEQEVCLFETVTFEGFLQDVAQKQNKKKLKKEKEEMTRSTAKTMMTLAVNREQCSSSRKRKVSDENNMLVAPSSPSRQNLFQIDEALLPDPSSVLRKRKLSIGYIIS